MSSRPIGRLWAAAAIAVTLTVLSAPALAHADRLFWANFGSPERISSVNIDGSGGFDLNTAGATMKIPIGLDIDNIGRRVYWTNESAPGGISFANLDGSGGGTLNTGAATVKGPSGAAIGEFGSRRISWGNVGDGTIGWANLDGSGGGTLNTGAATITAPYALEIVPGAGRVYWTNTVKEGSIGYANLDGSGGGNVPITGSATLESPFGLAVVGGRIYWANSTVAGKISYANLDGSGSADLNTAGATVSEPYGVAVDPDRNRIYWANSNGGLGYADLSGQGGANLPTAPGFAGGAPNSPNLLAAPRGVKEPGIVGSSRPGEMIDCGEGIWSLDVPSSSFYVRPSSYAFQWSRNGKPIAGAATRGFSPRAVGEYTCTEIASNLGGSGSQTTVTAPVFRIGKARFDRRKGTATVPVELPGGGTLRVSGKGLKTISRPGASARTVKVRIRARGKALKRLRRSNKSRMNLDFRYLSPAPGAIDAVQERTIFLRKKK